MTTEYNTPLAKLIELQETILDVHPLLGHLYPVVLAKNGNFIVFDIDPSGRKYQFKVEAPAPIPVPKGVRAAFQLECYDGRVACVVTDDAFDSLDGYATIFHEFVHCHQFETCEMQLRESLGIAQKAKAEGDLMWEINYPFPYDDPHFGDAYQAFLSALEIESEDEIARRRDLIQILKEIDYEYLTWQEWKEGFARLVENKVRERLGLQTYHGGASKPFSRVSFYEGGSRYIQWIAEQAPGMLLELDKLFYRMMVSASSNPKC